MCAATDSAHLSDFNSQFITYLKYVISAEHEVRTLLEFEQQLIEEQYFPNGPKLFLEPDTSERLKTYYCTTSTTTS